MRETDKTAGIQQNTDDYQGASGAGVLPKLSSSGEGTFTAKGANAAPGENDRYGGVDFAARLAAVQNIPAKEG